MKSGLLSFFCQHQQEISSIFGIGCDLQKNFCIDQTRWCATVANWRNHMPAGATRSKARGR